MRVALGLEYHGAGFSGWQSQPSGMTLQDALESALKCIAGVALRTVCAGRTDTGVHATSQVVHFDTAVHRPLSAWVRGVNAHLPDSIAVQWAAEVSEAFHARFSALSRSYRYVLCNRASRPAILAGQVGWCFRELDVVAMINAARCLLGEHDFSSFRAAECQAKSPVRVLHRCDVKREGNLIYFDLHANAFLHHMVRNIVGSLVYVGLGRQSVDWLCHLLEARDRRLAAPTFSPDGLYLTQVDYAPAWGLPEVTRIIKPPLLPVA